MRSVLLCVLAVTAEAFVAPVSQQSAVSRSVISSSALPLMFAGGSKAAPKKAAKKVAKKAAKKVVKKVVRGKAAPPPPKNGIQRVTEKFFSEENWAIQAVQLLAKLPGSPKNGRE